MPREASMTVMPSCILMTLSRKLSMPAPLTTKASAFSSVFSKLRTLLVVSVVLATATLIGFSYIVVYDYARTVWKYQWL